MPKNGSPEVMLEYSGRDETKQGTAMIELVLLDWYDRMCNKGQQDTDHLIDSDRSIDVRCRFTCIDWFKYAIDTSPSTLSHHKSTATQSATDQPTKSKIRK